MLTDSRINLADLAVVAWICVWIAMGVAIGVELGHLAALGRSMTSVGQAIHTTGSALHLLSSVPLVGGAISAGARAVQSAGASAVNTGNQTQSSISALSVLLAIAVAVLPTVPVLILYVPARVRRHREAVAVRSALSNPAHLPELREFLAQQALHTLGFHRLSRLGVHVAGPLSEEEQTALAQAQLRRLQIDPAVLGPPSR